MGEKRTKSYCKTIDNTKLFKYYMNAKANILTTYTKYLFFIYPDKVYFNKIRVK